MQARGADPATVHRLAGFEILPQSEPCAGENAGCAFLRRDVGGGRSAACHKAMNQTRRLALTDLMDTAARLERTP